MKLREALDEVPKRDADDDGVIFAQKPWTLDSDADIFVLDPDKPRPQEIADRNLQYFLEIHVGQEALEVFRDRTPTLTETRALLVFYAEHDGFPDWAFG